jgi:mannose/cellobiose epimerase-like protein (N-acyl-D-glucosamine 2-epimerase family)
MVEDDKRQFEDATQSLYGAERELMVAMQNFVDAQARAGKSKGHALDIMRRLLWKTRDEKAKRNRAAFKIVE